jgi:HlyD family secretion protein
MNKKLIIIISVVVLALIGGCYLLTNKKADNTVNFEKTTVGRSSISTSVTATGTVEAVTTVDVGTQVSGIVTNLYVDYNSPVKKGQVIAELDRTTLLNDLESQQANLRSAQAELQYQRKNYERYAELNKKQLVSKQEYDVALESYRKAQEQVKMAQQSVGKARTNLGYATITSPIDGVVISKEVEVGQTVASSFSTPTLITIAKDLKDMQVVADVDEADIGEVKEGQRVTFTVDAYPNDTFSGVVKQVRQNATTTNNVVTYEVVISAPNPDLKLKPGLTANVTIYTLERTNVKSVPSKALRFTPEPMVIGNKYKIKDVNASHKLWTLEGNTFTAHKVEVGMTDGIHTEILSGMSEGKTVILDVVATSLTSDEDDGDDDSKEENPFGPKRPGADKDKKKGSANGSK